MAVTVSSKALEATTMVMQSDLDVIVKSSRDEVFVFAENMLSGKPWPGAHLLVSNGQEVIGEGTTDAHGVFQKSYKEMKPPTSGSEVSTADSPAAESRGTTLSSNDVRVFAMIDGNVASNLLNLQGVGVAQGLTDKGLYLYRPPGLPCGATGEHPRLPPPRGQRRLRDRQGQAVHGRRF